MHKEADTDGRASEVAADVNETGSADSDHHNGPEASDAGIANPGAGEGHSGEASTGEAYVDKVGAGEAQAGDTMAYSNEFGVGGDAFCDEVQGGGSDDDPYCGWFEKLRMKVIAEHDPISPPHANEVALPRPAESQEDGEVYIKVEREESRLEYLPRRRASETSGPEDRTNDSVSDLDGWNDCLKIGFEAPELIGL